MWQKLLLLVCLLLFAGKVYAQKQSLKTFEAPRYNLSLSYPDTLLSLPPPIPQSLLFLRKVDALHPTFNIVVQPKIISKKKSSLKKRVRKLLASYREVGLTDSEVVEYHEVTVSGHDALSASLTFSQGATSFRSHVTLVPLSNTELIFTYIDTSAGYNKNNALRRLILSSISLPSSQTEPLTSPTAQPTKTLWKGLGAIVSLFVIVLLWRFSKNRDSAS